MDIFDFYKNLVQDKKPISTKIIETEFNEKQMNVVFSYDKFNASIAAAVAKYYGIIPRKSFYLFYLISCDKRRAQFLNMKKDVNEEENELIELAKMFLPGWSKIKIVKSINILKSELLLIKNDTTKGGLSV